MPSRRSLRIALRWVAILVGLGLASSALVVVYGVALVDRSLAGGAVSTGARVLSAPLVVRSGDRWRLGDVEAALRRRGIARTAGAVPDRDEYAVLSDGIRAGPGVLEGASGTVLVTPSSEGVVLRDDAGERLAEVRVRPVVIGATPRGDVIRWPVPLGKMSSGLLTAVVDIEDRGFLGHGGLSFRGLLRAAWRDLLAGGIREGGSTITQQLAKILLLRPARTVPRKVVEAWLAALLEYRFNKRTILEAYLNRVYLGQDGGWQIQGVEAAAQFYFGKPSGSLDVAEGALLAGLIAAPNRFDPFAHPDAARERRAAVIRAMVREGHLEAGEGDLLASRPLPAGPHHLRWAPAAQAVERALQLPQTGDVFASSLDVDIQEAVHDGCAAAVARLENRSNRLQTLRREGDPLQVAVVVLSPAGQVLALQGSRLGLAGEFDRAVAARRQIGSLVKPFVVSLALEEGWSLDSSLEDEPLSVAIGRQTWTPVDDDGRFRGAVSVREALVHSLNVPIVRLGLELRLSAVVRRLREVGFAPPDGSPAILLGSFEATPLEVARAFAALDGDGELPPLSFAQRPRGPRQPVLDPRDASDVRSVLEDVVRQGTAAAVSGSFVGRLAGKTGTTDKRRDSWFVGLRPRLVCVVWVGTDGNQETGLYGATGALEVWREIDARMPPVWWQGEFGDGD